VFFWLGFNYINLDVWTIASCQLQKSSEVKLQYEKL